MKFLVSFVCMKAHGYCIHCLCIKAARFISLIHISTTPCQGLERSHMFQQLSCCFKDLEGWPHKNAKKHVPLLVCDLSYNPLVELQKKFWKWSLMKTPLESKCIKHCAISNAGLAIQVDLDLYKGLTYKTPPYSFGVTWSIATSIKWSKV